MQKKETHAKRDKNKEIVEGCVAIMAQSAVKVKQRISQFSVILFFLFAYLQLCLFSALFIQYLNFSSPIILYKIYLLNYKPLTCSIFYTLYIPITQKVSNVLRVFCFCSKFIPKMSLTAFCNLKSHLPSYPAYRHSSVKPQTNTHNIKGINFPPDAGNIFCLVISNSIRLNESKVFAHKTATNRNKTTTAKASHI